MENSEAMEVDKKRPARFSKNKKRNWKKVDISTEESFLEKKRFDEIQFGGDITEQKDGDLFFIDKKGTIGQNKKVRKVPHVERILQNKSKVAPPIHSEKRAQTNKSKRQEEAKLKKRFQTLNLQQQAVKNRKTLSQVRKEQGEMSNTYDLWDQKPTTSKFSPAEHAKTIDGRARAKRPEKMKYKPDKATETNSVIPAHPGASYNPDFDAHQALLREEVDRAQKEKVVRNKFFKKCQPAPEGERVTADDIVNESMQGLGLLPDSEEEHESDDEEKKVIKAPIRAENRKSKKQRLKERKVKVEQTRARRRKKLRILMSQIYEVKRIKREIKERDAALEERRKYRKEKGEKRMPRLGQIKYKEPEQDLKLSTELTGTLRQLVPEGHVLTDRLQSFMSRTMIEPRSRQGKQKLKFRPKWQQKRAFREFDEKFEAELKKEEKMAK